MARMLPARVLDTTVSRAERRLFEKIGKDLDDRWAVFHSLGFVGHARKPWAEVDFVLVGPQGIYCLEVKGGRIRREEGLWVFTDRWDQDTVRREGPFDQVGSATATLRKALLEHFPHLSRAPIQFGVATPDIEWTIDGPDTPRVLVCDSLDMQGSFTAYVDRIAEYWHRWQRESGRQAAGLDAEHRQAAVDFLRGDFDLRPSLPAHLGLISEEQLRLTEQQQRAARGLSLNDRVIVSGGPGTGKTLLAIDEARREATEGRRVLLTCFNKRLGSLMKGALQDTEGVTVLHFHGFMAELVHRAGLTSKLPPEDTPDFFTVHYPGLAAEALVELDELGSVDTLIVDEGQDLLMNPYLDLLDELLAGGLSSGRWRFFLDYRQNIYHADLNAAASRVGRHRPARFELTINCRNTAPIAETASLFGNAPVDEVSTIEGPEVTVRWYSEGQQVQVFSALLSELVEDGVDLDRVVVLSRRRLQNSRMPSALPSGLVLWDGEASRPSQPCVEFSTIQAFKGLEKDIVIVVGVDDLQDPEARLAWYVGFSRASGLLIPLVTESQRAHYEQLHAAFQHRTTDAARSEAG